MSNFKTCLAPCWLVHDILEYLDTAYSTESKSELYIDKRYLDWFADCGLVEQPYYFKYDENDEYEKPKLYTKCTLLGQYVRITIRRLLPDEDFDSNEPVQRLIERFDMKAHGYASAQERSELPKEYVNTKGIKNEND